MNKGVNENSSSVGLRSGRSRILPGLMSPCTIEASLCIQSKVSTSFEARLSQVFMLPRTGIFMFDVVLDASVIIEHDLMWSSRDSGCAAMTSDDSSSIMP